MVLTLPLILTIAVAIAKTSSAIASGPNHDKVVVCYVSGWAVYRPDNGSFSVDNINPQLCTHLVYAFAGLNGTDNTIISLDKYNDLEDDYGKGTFKKITNLKNKFPHLKVSIAIGGWNEESLNYSRMAESESTRQQFVQSVSKFIRKYNFDGLDLDWEYPAQRGGKPDDKANFVSLIKDLSHEFAKFGWLLTAALGAAKHIIDTSYDIPSLSKYLDYIHIMCYDYHGSWDKMTGANAPLYGNSADDVLSVDYTIKYLLKLGAPSKKMLLGVPLYGRTFYSNESITTKKLGLPALDKGFQGPYTREDGYMGYHEICKELKSSSWNEYWDDKSLTPFAIDNDKVISYDDHRSITEKVLFAMKHNLGGIMVWPLDTDDFHGICSTPYPMMRAINTAITSAKPSKNSNSASKFSLSALFVVLVLAIV